MEMRSRIDERLGLVLREKVAAQCAAQAVERRSDTGRNGEQGQSGGVAGIRGHL